VLSAPSAADNDKRQRAFRQPIRSTEFTSRRIDFPRQIPYNIAIESCGMACFSKGSADGLFRPAQMP
jgi:hypothetical protein